VLSLGEDRAFSFALGDPLYVLSACAKVTSIVQFRMEGQERSYNQHAGERGTRETLALPPILW